MPNPLKIIFAGTPDFAAVTLSSLLCANHQVVAVYTQPDRPAGRGRKITCSAVKEVAVNAGLDVYQPVSLKEEAEQVRLKALQADVMLVVAYGLILPKSVLDIPKFGCLNIHGSLLPRWRGAAPIQQAIFAGDQETGITIMQMDAGLDTGDMLLKVSCPIQEKDTSQSLHDRLASLGAELALQALDHLSAGQLNPIPQDDSQACYAQKLKKSEANIDWTADAVSIHRKIHAFNPWPVAQTYWQDKVLRIWGSEVIAHETVTEDLPGTVIHSTKKGFDVATGQGVLRLLKLQLAGGKPMAAEAFLNAHCLTGVILGSGAVNNKVT